MLLVSIDVEYRYDLTKKIKKINDNIKTTIFTSNDILYNDYKKYKYVVTEYNTKIIDYFIKLNKIVVVCCFDEEMVKQEYREHPNIFICRSRKDAIDLILAEYSNRNITDTNIYKNIKSFVYVLIFTVFLALLFKKLYVCEYLPKSKKKTNSPEVVDLKKENYVFLGDSITDYYDLDKYYQDVPVVNSGISGNKCNDILDNLQDRVFKYNPTKVFLLIGTNDIAYTDIENEELVDRIIEICDKIHEKREETEIYVQSIYPVNRKADSNMVAGRNNERIKEINKLIKEKVEEKKYKYLDMYSILKDKEDNLDLAYTYDGLHISDKGYKVITKEINKIIL